MLEGSLKRLHVDQIDLIHIHSLTNEDDLAKIEAKGGVLDTLHKLKDQKMTRFIGITSHTDPTVLAKALERHDFDCTQMALNAALVGMKNGKAGMVINEAMKTELPDPRIAGSQSQEDGRNRDEGLRAGRAARSGAFREAALLLHVVAGDALYSGNAEAGVHRSQYCAGEGVQADAED